MLSKKSKNAIFFLLVLAFIVTLVFTGQIVLAENQTEAMFAGGAGTEDDPYLIADAKQLDKVRNYLDAHFKLVNDIDLGVPPYNEGEGWEPIGSYAVPFNGVFDGNGKTIRGLYIYRGDQEDVGLFSSLGEGAVLKNVRLEDVDVLGENFVGALVGWNTAGQIIDCYVSGAVAGENNIGGLTGGNEEDGRINNCFSACDVVAQYYAGGLAGYNQGEIFGSNHDGLITGIEDVGGLVGYNEGDIVYCFSASRVIGVTSIGGLVGYNADGWVFGSFSTGNVVGSENVGGLVGYNRYEVVTDSYAISAVSGTTYVGGLIGYNEGTIAYSYAAGTVAGESDVGGLVGFNDGGNVLVSYYDWEATGQSDTGKGEPKSTYEMMARFTYEGWDFLSTWALAEGTDYPVFRYEDEAPQSGFDAWVPRGSAEPGVEVQLKLTSAMGADGLLLSGSREVSVHNETTNETIYSGSVEFFDGEAFLPITLNALGTNRLRVHVKDISYTDLIPLEVLVLEFAGGSGTHEDPYLIADADDLNNVRYCLTACFKVIDDIDLNVAPYNHGEGWLPIGTGWVPFVGHFDGNGKTIKGLYINRSISDDVGLFGCIWEGAIVENVKLKDANVTGREYVGALVGWNYEGRIVNSSASGVVAGESFIGGLVGENNGLTIDSYATSRVTSTKYVAGGLAGTNFGEITGSYATGPVTGNEEVGGFLGINQGSVSKSYATGTVNGYEYVGGLVGANYEGQITNSYSTGFVFGYSEVGGLAGTNEAHISNGYATSNVAGGLTTGGLVGSNHGEIFGSYASGAVIGNEDVGGLAGSNEGSITKCYATGEVNGAEYVGGLVGWNYQGQITDSWATGDVLGIEYVDKLVGFDSQ